MPTGLEIESGGYKGDLEGVFNPLQSEARAAVNIKGKDAQGIEKDLSEIFEPTNGFDQIQFDTGYLADNTDLRYIFQRKGYLPRYYILPDLYLVSENDTITVQIDTVDVIPGTTVCYETTSNDDFTNPTGTITIDGTGRASFLLTIANDLTTEGTETFNILIKNCETGAVISTSDPITIRDTSKTPPTYTLNTTSVSVNEGDTVAFEVITTDVDDGTILYYTTTSNSDFISPTGSVVITGNRGSFELQAKADLRTEGTEVFTVDLKTSSITGITVATSPEVLIKDTSRTPPTYQITPNKTAVREGEAVSFTVVTTDVDDDTVLYYTVSLPDDITPNSGSFAIKNNTASFSITVKEDMLSEGRETFTVDLKTGSTLGTTVRTSASITIITDCFKGSTKLSEITTNPLNNSQVSFGNFGAGRYVIEYISGAWSAWQDGDRWLTGPFELRAGVQVSNIGDSGVYTENIVESKGVEWNNRFNVFAHTGGDISLTIKDTPLTDNRIHPGYGAPKYAIYDYTCGDRPVYSLTTDKAVVREGDTIRVTVNTTGIVNGTVLFYDTTSNSDLDNPTGSVTINNNTGTFNLAVKRDLTYESADEIFVINLRRGSISGSIAAVSQSITILADLPPTYAITSNITTAEETSTDENDLNRVVFTITTTNVPDTSTLYYKVVNISTDSNDFTGLTSGSVQVYGNTASFTINIKEDFITEGTESFRVDVLTGSTSGTVVARSNSISIQDTSLAPTYILTTNKNSINEGESLTFNITTTNVPSGTTLYYDINNITTNSGDFVSSSGTAVINNNRSSFTIDISNDLTTETIESFEARLRVGSSSGSIVATSNTITINDTSKTPSTYSIASNATTVDEGGSVIFTITTTNVANNTPLYYDIANETTSNRDFNNTAGSVLIVGNSATFTVTVKDDLTTEGIESFRARIRTGSTTGTVVATSNSININDTSLSEPTYTITPDKNTVVEDETVTYNVTTTNIVNGTTLFYSIPGIVGMLTSDTDINICIDNTSLLDETKNTIKNMTESGVLKRMLLPYYNNDEALYSERVKIFINNDERTFGSNYLNRSGRAGNRVVNIAFQDESEGQSSISYENKNNANYAADIPALRTKLNNSINSHYGIVFQVEGNNNFKTFLQKVKAGTGVFSELNLKDKSEIVFFYDFPGGTTTTQLTYATKILEAFRALGLVTDNLLTTGDVDKVSGSVTIQDGRGSFAIKAARDFLMESNESFILHLKTSSIYGATVATSSSVTILDSNCRKGAKLGECITNPRSTGSVAFNTGTLAPGWYIIEYISGAQSFWNTGDKWLSNGFYVSNNGNRYEYLDRVPSDFSATSNSIEDIYKNWFGENRPYYKVINHPGGTLELAIADNPVTDNRSHPNGAAKYALYEYICGVPTYAITVPESVNEGSSFTANITTTSVPNGTQLYYECSNTSDITPTSGTVTIQNNAATITFNVIADLITEGLETFSITLRTSTSTGPLVSRSSLITINDTSKKPTFSIQPSSSEVKEGEEVTFNVTTSNISNGTQLNFTLSRTDVTPSTGTITIQDNRASFKVKTSILPDEYATFYATLKYVGGSDILATSSNVGIKGEFRYRDTITITVQYNLDGPSIYVYASSPAIKDSSKYFYRLHGLDVSSLGDRDTVGFAGDLYLNKNPEQLWGVLNSKIMRVKGISLMRKQPPGTFSILQYEQGDGTIGGNDVVKSWYIGKAFAWNSSYRNFSITDFTVGSMRNVNRLIGSISSYRFISHSRVGNSYETKFSITIT